MRTDRYDVIVVGGGPTGMVTARALGQLGHRVALVERHASPYNLPRAGHLDHEVFRILQNLDVVEPILADARPKRANRWLNGEGEVMFTFEHWGETTSWHPSASFYQPVLEQAVLDEIGADPNVEILFGHEVVDLRQDECGVTVTLSAIGRESGPLRLGGRFLVGADGANSFVRGQVGVDRDDFGFNETWLTVDAALVGEADFGEPAVVGDPLRPHFFGPLGLRHHRFEWQLLPGEQPEDFADRASVWKLLQPVGATPDNVRIVRQAIFTFEYRVATRWRVGRVLLAGDAAHTMPPCLGQGMCSGLRDVANLAWKLDLVLRERSDPDLLDSYQAERLPHVRSWGDMARDAGRLAFTTDLAEARARDDRIRRGELPTFGPAPALGAGVIHRSARERAGTMFPQRPVLHDGRRELFDDVVRAEFVALEIDRASDTSPAEIVGRYVFSGDPREVFTLTDVDGGYEEVFEGLDAQAIVVRPDRYLYAIDSEGGQLSRLVADLAVDLSLTSTTVDW
jgi:3-(3-hydroxy-phenyl)propionate hydroxylase